MIHKDMENDEEHLIQRVKEGDQEAFQTLFDKYQTTLFRTIYYKTKDHGLAQDIAQDTFVRVWLKRETLKPNLSFFSLIAKISQNLVQDHYKHQQVRLKHQNHVKLISEKHLDNPEQELKQTRLKQRIREVANSSLPNKCRSVFLLSRVGGLSNQEIANTMNISKKTVENQLHHAMKILRKKCADYL